MSARSPRRGGHSGNPGNPGSLAIVVIYLLAGVAWTIISEFGPAIMAGVKPLLDPVGMLNRLGFVAGSAIVIAFVLRHRDSERHRARRAIEQKNEELLQSHKLEALGRLAAGVAHDFNNVMTVIMSHAEFLAEALPQGSKLRQEVDGINATMLSARGLTKQLLLFGRQSPGVSEQVQVNTSIRNIEPMVRRLIGADIRFVVEPAAKYDTCIISDTRIEQVILNMVVNARDAMPRGGSLLIETQDVLVGPERLDGVPDCLPGEYVMVAISDTGMGMDEATRLRCFDPFFTTKDAAHGTGLGLATTHGIVRDAGGFIAVYSAQDKGTTFKIYLPVINVPAPVQVQPKPVPVLGRKRTETILVADDEAPVRNVVVASLTRAGYTVLAAASPMEALEIEKAHRGEIDLLLTDLVMPGMLGTALAAEIRRRRPGIRLLLASGYTDRGARLVEEGVGDVDFLEKPFEPRQLVERVAAVLDKPRDDNKSGGDVRFANWR